MNLRTLAVACIAAAHLGCGPSAPDDESDSGAGQTAGASSASESGTADAVDSTNTGANADTVASSGSGAVLDSTSGDASTSGTTGAAVMCGATTCGADEICVVSCCGGAGCCFAPFEGGCAEDGIPTPGQCGPMADDHCLAGHSDPIPPFCRPMLGTPCDRDGMCSVGTCTGPLNEGVLACQCPWG